MFSQISGVRAAVLAFFGAVFLATSGQAAVVSGVVVGSADGLTPATPIFPTNTETDPSSGLVVKDLLGPDAVKYFIPLNISGTTCVYAVTCGTSSDSGSGSKTDYMSMFLQFGPVPTGVPGTLTLKFLDLDVYGANDPSKFLEALIIHNLGPDQEFVSINDPGFSLVPANPADPGNVLQVLELDFASLNASPFVVELRFKSCFSKNIGDYPNHYCNKHGRNTPEYLSAHITTIPLPAAAWLLIGGIGALGAARARRKS